MELRFAEPAHEDPRKKGNNRRTVAGRPDGVQSRLLPAHARQPNRACQRVAQPRYTRGNIIFSYRFSVMKRLSLLFIACACLLAGCGQKGPLYLPDDQKAAKEHRHDVF
ncbi:hypothetical protein thsps117_01770 [Pseudomonas sp. No.117]